MLDEFIASRIEVVESNLVKKNDFLNERDKFDNILSQLESTLTNEQQNLLEKILSSKNYQS